MAEIPEFDKKTLVRNKQIIRNLKKKPFYEQKTEAWYKQRQTRITASEAASCLYKVPISCDSYIKRFDIKNFKYNPKESMNSYKSREDYIVSKAAEFYGQGNFMGSAAMDHGNKFEAIAARLYCKLYNTDIHEFGMLEHRNKFLGASPDGITNEGRLIEIKCPKVRKIDGIPPIYYWVQVQIQLEVCNLEVCDFVEVALTEYTEPPLAEGYAKLETPGSPSDALGLVLEVAEKKYIYPPRECNVLADYISWADLPENKDYKRHYYSIDKYSIVPIQRDTQWFLDNKDQIKQTWQIIRDLQNDRTAFDKYRESMNELKNKKYNELYNKTQCIIDDTTIDTVSSKQIKCIIDSCSEEGEGPTGPTAEN